ncbi:hypothetical protein M3D15_03755 [Pseudoclavibacter alba]|uniref:Uncharacterized protein n=1 Tax=Pseudoclavibacter albus TaxID=272241 RepID=A0ABT2HVV7_9MICO|nr:hypothetical protein [Pseudoclavibacter alba]MCT2042452.1 hypothetical protein [Pseudoclavibacter alba]
MRESKERGGRVALRQRLQMPPHAASEVFFIDDDKRRHGKPSIKTRLQHIAQAREDLLESAGLIFWRHKAASAARGSQPLIDR